MFPFSPVQVVEQTPSRLVVVDPPYYLAGICLTAASLLLAAFLWMQVDDADPQGRIGWPALVMAAPFLLIGLLLLTNVTTATLSRASNTLRIDRSYLGMVLRRREFPLSEVRCASVGTDQQTRRLAFVLVSGEEVWLGSFTDRKGYYAAADAINAFLGGQVH
jgi:hypothetical protein